MVLAHLNNIPALDEIDPEECRVYWDILLTSDHDEDAIRDVFIFVEDDCELTVQKIDDGSLLDQPEDYKRLGEILVERGDLTESDLAKYLQEKRRLGEALVAEGAVDSNKVKAALFEQERVQKLRKERKTQDAMESIRVKSDRLDKLVNLVGEMVTVQARLSQLAGNRIDADLLGISEEVERLTWDLRDQVLNIRMLPIGVTFTRFKRLVRDLGTELGKNVVLITDGGDTELDKTVIDQLNDPLVHLVRNSIGHGIEAPESRSAAGKPRRGRITLSAKHTGANVVLTVADDGVVTVTIKLTIGGCPLARKASNSAADRVGLGGGGARSHEPSLTKHEQVSCQICGAGRRAISLKPRRHQTSKSPAVLDEAA